VGTRFLQVPLGTVRQVQPGDARKVA
jgi:hypothetical protein